MNRLTSTKVLLLAVFLAVPGLLQAQMRTVSGLVSDGGSSQPVAGVQIMVMGTTRGTLTDAQGRFSLPVPEGSTHLVFTYIGFKSVEMLISDNMEVVLEPQALGLEGIVVTALGVQREKRSLGYSVQDS